MLATYAQAFALIMDPYVLMVILFSALFGLFVGCIPGLTATMATALKKVYDSKDYKEFMNKQGLGMVWADPEGTTKFMAASDANLGAALKAVGLAK